MATALTTAAGTAAGNVVEDGFMSIREACAFLRVSRTEVYAMMERGELAFAKLGRRRLIPRRGLVESAQRAMVTR